jgi:hypothetical protein
MYTHQYHVSRLPVVVRLIKNSTSCFGTTLILSAEFYLFYKYTWNFMFCWPCISVWSLQITNLTHNSFLCMFISILYMFWAAMCPSSGELIVSIHLVYVTLYRWTFSVQVWMILQSSPIQTCTPNVHLYRVTYTRWRIDTINSPDDGHMAARNM